jgi:hypothetical protein
MRVARLIPSWHLLFESVPTRTQDSILGYNLKLHSQEFVTPLRMFHDAHYVNVGLERKYFQH